MTEYEKIQKVLKLGTELNTVQDVDILLERILYEARKFVSADAGTIYLKEGDSLVFAHAQNDTKQALLPPGKKLIYSSFKVPVSRQSISGYVASTGETLCIHDVYNIDQASPYSFDSTIDKKSGYMTKSMLTFPLINLTGDVLGVLQMINPLDGRGEAAVFTTEDELYITHFASSASIVLQRAQMTRSMVLRMIQMAELRDPKETGPHVNRVASYSVEIYEKWAKNHGVDPEEIEKTRDSLKIAAMLHDVGKVAISDIILKKPARFTDEEYAIMKSHTYLGARLFNSKHSVLDSISCDVALMHHENWDGTGYPGYIDLETGEALEKNLKGEPLPRKGEEISLFGRIVSLADVFDALSSKRVYKNSWEEGDVLREIAQLSGSKFDPEVVDVFFEVLDVIKSIQSKYPDKEE